jgi:hypothetical protein
MKLFKYIFALIAFALYNEVYSQNNKLSESMHESGKIYVFLGVVLIILAGLFVYLFILEKKIKKLEKNK